MSKRALSIHAVTTKDWMKYRPYDRFSSYDGYYLRQANAVFQMLNHPDTGFRPHFQRDHLVELAVLCTSYFEDFINDIGLWRALVRKHQELYGYPVPFYHEEAYDPEYLNPQDFAYLIWHHLGKMANKTLAPYSSALQLIAHQCYEHFEERIEEAPATDFYERWLKIGPDTPFFDLKRRLQWMAFDNYLLGPEFSQALLATLKEMTAKDSEIIRTMDPGKLAYALEDEYLYIKCSSWCAMATPDWLAEVAQYPDGFGPNIRRLAQRVYGTFVYEGFDDRYYHFRFIRSKRLFPIRRDSVSLDPKRMKPGEEAGLFGIVNWCGDWWLSGTYLSWRVSDKQIEKGRHDPTGINFYGWTEAEQGQIRERSAEMEAAFIEYFGDRLVLFPDQKTMTAALEAQQAWWNEKKASPAAPGTAASTRSKQLAEQSAGFKNLKLADRRGVAVFFEPGKGMLISPVVPEIIRLLQAGELAPPESDPLFHTFFRECGPPLARLLIERYSGKNLRHPFQNDPDFVAEHVEFFLRYYDPDGFREVTPNLTLVE